MTKKGKHMHFRTVKETRKLRGFSDLFMVNRRLIIIIILIIGKGFLLLFIYYYLLSGRGH